VLAAAGFAVQACAADGPTGTASAPPPRAEAPAAVPTATPGPLETARGAARAGAVATAGDVAWVGEMHNRGLAAVVARAALARTDERASAASRCRLVGRHTATWLASERARDPHLRALGPVALSDGTLAGIAQYTACGAVKASGRPLREALADAAATAASPGAGRMEIGVGDLSPAARNLIDYIDGIVTYGSGPAVISSSLVPVEQAAQQLPDENERTLVLEAAITARASAYYHHQHGGCTDPTGCTHYRPPDDIRAPLGDVTLGSDSLGGARRTGVNSEVIKADVWGCIYGGFRGFMAGGGPPGVFAGCLWGGIGASGGIIFRHVT
jgi:hypothetical protein